MIITQSYDEMTGSDFIRILDAHICMRYQSIPIIHVTVMAVDHLLHEIYIEENAG